uniref:Signal peptide peptidase n=1 Tax=Parastrongyloides trichosuri TaxID=131310 RepID=A0A0N4ZX31_PARTI
MSSFAYLQVSSLSNPSSQPKQYCINYNQFAFTKLPSEPSNAKKSSLTELRQFMYLGEKPYPNTTLLTMFNDRKLHQLMGDLPHDGIENVMFYIIRGQSHTEEDVKYITSNFYLPQYIHHPTPMFYIYKEDVDDMRKFGNDSDLQLAFFRPPDSSFEYAEIFIFLIAITCITLGSYLGVYNASRRSQTKVTLPTTTPDYDLSATSKCTTDSSNGGENSTLSINNIEEEKKPSTTMTSFCILIQISFLAGILLLTYFYRDKMMILFYTAIIAVGTFSITILFKTITMIFFKKDPIKFTINDITQKVSGKRFNVELMREEIGGYCVIGFILGLIITITWFVNKNHPYSFMLLNFINLCISINLISLLETYRFIWIIIVMIGLLLYDFFMVFVTPYITPDGCSLMIKAATGKDCQSPEQISRMAQDEWEPLPSPEQNYAYSSIAPMVFMFPRLSDSMLSCLDLSVELEYKPTLLGMGDVVIPGIAVAFSHHADKFLFKQKTYYGLYSIIGYSLGLITTMFALEYMQMAQPALIYLVPFTLLSILIPALIRKEFKKFVFTDLSLYTD